MGHCAEPIRTVKVQSLCCILLKRLQIGQIFLHSTERFIEAADRNPHVPESRTHENSRALLSAFVRTHKLKQNLRTQFTCTKPCLCIWCCSQDAAA